MSKFLIPVDSAIDAFAAHLDANARTILSAKFGDGKSYFLDKFKQDTALLESYTFLTIYPVNYQVVENKDIFDLLKHDILCQLILNGIITDDFELTDKDILPWFLLSKSDDLLLELIQYSSAIGLDDNLSKILSIAAGGLKLFSSFRQQYSSFKNKNAKPGSQFVEEYLTHIESEHLYECDPITNIIKRAISSYQRANPDKKIVLFIEDMDRMDPAHMFRILNILSAHMDSGYRLSAIDSNTLAFNKFGVDKIVVVIDYKNLRHIYQHFYGIHTDFNGYISKFLSSVPFNYSLKELQEEYLVNEMIRLTGLSKELIKQVVTQSMLTDASLRELSQSFSISNQILCAPFGFDNSTTERIKLNTSMLKLMAILRRLKVSDEEIQNTISKLRQTHNDDFVKYVTPYMFEEDIRKEDKKYPCIATKDRDHGEYKINIALKKEDGTAYITGTQYFTNAEKPYLTSYSKYVKRMLQFIVK